MTSPARDEHSAAFAAGVLARDNHCPMLRRLERKGLARDPRGFVPKRRMTAAFRSELGATPGFVLLFVIAPIAPHVRATVSNLIGGRVDFARLGGDGFFNHRWRSGLYDRAGDFDPAAFARMAAQSADGRGLTLAEWCAGLRAELERERRLGGNVPHGIVATAWDGVFCAFESALLFAVLGRKDADGRRRAALDEVRAFFAECALPDRFEREKPRPGGLRLLLDNANAARLLAFGARSASPAEPGGTRGPGAAAESGGPGAPGGPGASSASGAPGGLDEPAGSDGSAGLDRPAEPAGARGEGGARRHTGQTPEDRARRLRGAFDRGDSDAAAAVLEGLDADAADALLDAYRARFGRDLEWDMRGFSLDPALFRWRGSPRLSLRRRGLRGDGLRRAFRLLHGPRVERNARRIARLAGRGVLPGREGRCEIYGMLWAAGGEERELLDERVREHTGRSLAAVLGPVFRAHAPESAIRPFHGEARRRAAIVVSSGNWSRILSGEHDAHIGGYHWQEFFDEAEVAVARGWSVEFFTPEGLPPSPDALSLLEAPLGPLVGFGLARGRGPRSEVGRRIVEAFLQPRPLALEDGTFVFDASRFGTLHVAGGHGSPHDVVDNPAVERAAREMHERGRIVSAVCHATSALGPILEGGNVTGFPKLVDDVMLRIGCVLDEFLPPFDTHRDLDERMGARVSRVRATLNPMHTEVFRPGGGRAEIHTGTGPIATAPMARKKYRSIEAGEAAGNAATRGAPAARSGQAVEREARGVGERAGNGAGEGTLDGVGKLAGDGARGGPGGGAGTAPGTGPAGDGGNVDPPEGTGEP